MRWKMSSPPCVVYSRGPFSSGTRARPREPLSWSPRRRARLRRPRQRPRRRSGGRGNATPTHPPRTRSPRVLRRGDPLTSRIAIDSNALGRPLDQASSQPSGKYLGKTSTNVSAVSTSHCARSREHLVTPVAFAANDRLAGLVLAVVAPFEMDAEDALDLERRPTYTSPVIEAPSTAGIPVRCRGVVRRRPSRRSSGRSRRSART